MSDRELPPEVERIRHVLDPQVQSLSVLTDVLDGVLRFVAEILADDWVRIVIRPDKIRRLSF